LIFKKTLAAEFRHSKQAKLDLMCDCAEVFSMFINVHIKRFSVLASAFLKAEYLGQDRRMFYRDFLYFDENEPAAEQTLNIKLLRVKPLSH